MSWSGIHSHGRNRLVLNGTCNIQRDVDEVMQPEVMPYVQGDALRFQQYNAFPLSVCFTQVVVRSNAVHTLPWPAYAHPSCAPLSTGQDLTDHQVRKVTWPTSINHGAVIPGNLRGLGWHLKGKDYPDPWLPSDPTLPTDMQSCAWGTKFVTSVVDFAALNGLLHRV